MWFLILKPTHEELYRLIGASRGDEECRWRRHMCRTFPELGLFAPVEGECQEFENVARSIAYRRGLNIPTKARPVLQFADRDRSATLRWWIDERELNSSSYEVC